MSRGAARKRITPQRLRDELSGVFFDTRRARQLVEEAPSAYKDISAVMRAQRPLTRVRRRVRPLLSYKGV
jgi:tRNA-splicing ligase RtcB